MNFPDPITVLLLICEVILSVSLFRIGIATQVEIDRIARENPTTDNGSGHFVVSPSKRDLNSTALIPLIFFLAYLGLYWVIGTPTWTPDYFSRTSLSWILGWGGVVFFIALVSPILFIYVVQDPRLFTVVSSEGIESHKGKRTLSKIAWKDIVGIELNDDFIVFQKGKQSIRVNVFQKSITNKKRLCQLATSGLPEALRNTKPYNWMEKQLTLE